MIKDDVEILLVEDSPSDVQLTLRVLNRHKFGNPVHIFRDGAEVLSFIFSAGAGEDAERKLTKKPYVMLLDLKLPRVDGFEVLRRVKNDPGTRAIPVVVLTSSREERDIATSYELGANSYVVKPVGFAEFSRAIQLLGSYWLTQNETLRV